MPLFGKDNLSPGLKVKVDLRIAELLLPLFKLSATMLSKEQLLTL